ncbi:prolactin receptor [Aplochiton taeniatus]
MMIRPDIYYCRSPNMEVFTCWWHPLDNSSQGDENVTYTLTYSIDKGPRKECPDYKTGGPNSCYFDSTHTTVWRMYCLEVTARTATGNFTSKAHFLDVAEIVQTEAPVNLMYTLVQAGEEDTGHTALLSWTYPVPAHIQFGWITLLYELQYHRVNEPGKWQVKGKLREPHVELMGLAVGDYVVRVRCRSRNKGLWSRWSSSVLLSIPAQPTAGKLLALILATGVGVVALLVISFGIIPQGKRIKAFFLPPIPKPRIKGIDPTLLKKGRIDEINRHFTRSTATSRHATRRKPGTRSPGRRQPVLLGHPGLSPCSDAWPVERDSFLIQAGTGAYTPGAPPSPYCPGPAATLPSADPSLWAWPGAVAPYQPEMMSFPGTDYSVLGNTSPAAGSLVPVPPTPLLAFPASTGRPSLSASANTAPQDFYTCVHVMSEGAEVHLVPCTFVAEAAPPKEHILSEQEEERKKLQLADYLTCAMENATATGREDGVPAGRGGGERNEAALPLLPVTVGNRMCDL